MIGNPFLVTMKAVSFYESKKSSPPIDATLVLDLKTAELTFFDDALANQAQRGILSQIIRGDAPLADDISLRHNLPGTLELKIAGTPAKRCDVDEIKVSPTLEEDKYLRARLKISLHSLEKSDIGDIAYCLNTELSVVVTDRQLRLGIGRPESPPAPAKDRKALKS